MEDYERMWGLAEMLSKFIHEKCLKSYNMVQNLVLAEKSVALPVGSTTISFKIDKDTTDEINEIVQDLNRLNTKIQAAMNKIVETHHIIARVDQEFRTSAASPDITENIDE